MKKFNGPCIQCGKINDTWFARKLCVACYHKLQRSEDFKPRNKFTGPCAYCGKYESPNYNYARKLCKKCYTRWHITGSLEKIEKEKCKKCINCGTTDSKRKGNYFVKKRCIKCYTKYLRHKKNPPKVKIKVCVDCGITIEKGKPYTLKRCQKCYPKHKRKTDPIWKEKERQRIKRYESTQKGKETGRRLVRKRRAKLANVESTLTKEEWESILKKFNYKCAYCGSDKNIEMDHVIPISKNGTHTANNVVPACRSCNASKRDKILEELPFSISSKSILP